jgi:hypothetical protein
MKFNPFRDVVPLWIIYILSFMAAILIPAFLFWLWSVTG